MNDHTILLVDDYPELLTVLSYALVRKGYQVTTASSGKEAIEALAMTGFDLVITDLDMPEIDGLAVLRKAKEQDPDRGVMIMTGNIKSGSMNNALALGADDYLLKPFPVAELWDRVSSCLTRPEAGRHTRERGYILVQEECATSAASCERAVRCA